MLEEKFNKEEHNEIKLYSMNPVAKIWRKTKLANQPGNKHKGVY